ncbi:GPI transamidase component GAB1 [Verticillium dahliae VDG1]|nr:GPI transamidase component GAB1 [Verticillium dahliae VDG1]
MADQAATRRGRDALKQALLVGAYLLGIVATAIPVLLIFAGSWLVNDEKDASGPIRLALSKLSIASFDGIIPDPNNKGTYLLTMHLFPRALGWEYPSAPSHGQTAGIVNPTRGTLYLPTDFVTIGKALDLDPSAWGCFPPVWTDPCENPFFAAFRRQFPYEGTPDAWTVFLLSALVTCAAAIAAGDDVGHVRPRLGAAFVALSWTATAAGLGAVLCVLARLLLAQRTSWIDQQGAAPGLGDAETEAHGQRHVGLEEPAARTGLPDAQLKGYSDADPDAPLPGRAAEAEPSKGPPRNA